MDSMSNHAETTEMVLNTHFVKTFYIKLQFMSSLFLDDSLGSNLTINTKLKQTDFGMLNRTKHKALLLFETKAQ